ncbi:MAG: hypothetical protein ACFFG0_54150, partial [Candidatus Thorarchaeota archaeon]
IENKWLKQFSKWSKEEMLKDINNLYQLYKYLVKLVNNKKYIRININKLKSNKLEDLLMNMNTKLEDITYTVKEFFIYIRKVLYEELKVLEDKFPEVNIESILE